MSNRMENVPYHHHYQYHQPKKKKNQTNQRFIQEKKKNSANDTRVFLFFSIQANFECVFYYKNEKPSRALDQ